MDATSRAGWPRGVFLTVFCGIWFLPIAYVLWSALRKPHTKEGVFGLSLHNFGEALANSDFLGALLNSALIGIVSTLVILILAVPAAFICATREFSGRQLLEGWILSTRMLPPFVVVLPFFLLFRTFGLLDTMTCLIIMHVVVSLALAFFMLRSFFAELPREVLEAAGMEGAGLWRTLIVIALPLVRSGLMATCILVFIFSWNELAFAFTLAGGAVKTGPVAILSFMGFQDFQIGPLMAAATLLMLPIALLLIAAQKSLIRGMSFGTVD